MQKKKSNFLTNNLKVLRYEVNSGFTELEREVIKEIEYGLFINKKKFTSVMLVPEFEKEFFYGFLFTSGIIKSVDDVLSFRICERNNAYFILNSDQSEFENEKWTITSGCGGGKVLSKTYDFENRIICDFRVKADDILLYYKLLEKESYLHSLTRCVHKSYYFGRNGYTFTCEDIGRHNTIDKTIGAILLHNNSDFEGIIFTTGRLTSEMVLKCAKAKIPIVVSRTAPSKLGIRIAEKNNITLIGLTSTKGFTIFTGHERVYEV